jgi:signal transduction histidine kinase
MKIKLLIFLSFFTQFFILKSETIDLKKQVPTDYIGNYVKILSTENDTLKLEDVLKPSIQKLFLNSEKTVPRFHEINSHAWIEINITNVDHFNQWFLHIPYPEIDHLDFYAIRNDSIVKEIHTGNLAPFANREIKFNFFSFSLVPSCQRYFLHLISNTSPPLPLKIVNYNQLLKERHHYDLWQGIYLGLTLLIIIVNITIYYIIKDKIYLYYILHVLGTAYVVCTIQGYFNEFIFQDNSFYTNHSVAWYCLASIPTSFFIIKFLKTKEFTPLIDKMYWASVLVFILIGIIDFTPIQTYSRLLLQFTGLITALTILLAAIQSSKFYHPAKSFLIAWLFYFSGIVVLILVSLNIIPFNLLTFNAFTIGAGCELLFISLAVSDRIRVFKIEKDEWHEKTLQTLVEKERLIMEQNQMLETKVQERTKEIELHREEIINRNKEIQNKNQLLKTANEIIFEQNTKLTEYSQTLENQVKDRTNELFNSHKELIQKNTQLEQFTYVSAHNLRAPVATLLGLTSIMNDKEVSPENAFLIKKIRETSLKLDGIIIDLNTILDLTKGVSHFYEKINLEDLLEKIKDSLYQEIESNEVEIITQFLVKEAYGIRPYLQSIIYNLISNSIKYKAADRKPIIHIRAERNEENQLRLTVEDNGLGIDLEKYGSKLFGLYKRFNLHVQGKGLGLFIVKTQVELMEGKIEVQSVLGNKTIFIVHLPLKHESLSLPTKAKE